MSLLRGPVVSTYRVPSGATVIRGSLLPPAPESLTVVKSSGPSARATPPRAKSRTGTSSSERRKAFLRIEGRRTLRPHALIRNMELTTLTDGGQRAEDVAARLVAFLEPARRSLDLALYDVRLPGPVGDAVAGALRAAAARGVQVRIAFNEAYRGDASDSPPPRTQPTILESLGVPLRAIPGEPDLMHHKYVVRDGAAVWTGSTNWTLDSWTREENVLVSVESPAVAAGYERDFGELWRGGRVAGTGGFDGAAEAGVRPWFCPGRGEALSERIGAAIAAARTRVRIASPVITAGPVLKAIDAARADVAGIVDATQVEQVFAQWATEPHAAWKVPLLQRALARPFAGKHSTPYAPDTVHDFMHAKVCVCDDVVFTGSFNLSRSGEENAENVLEIHDAALAERLAAWIDELRARYAP